MNRVERLIASPVGAVIARPWFDTFALSFFDNWFFPLSRLWAAARAAHGSPEQFFAEVPTPGQPGLEQRLVRVLARFEQNRRAAANAEAAWEPAYFGGQPRDTDRLVEIEKHRLDCCAAYNAMRREFRFLKRAFSIPPIRWEIMSPMETASGYAQIMRHRDSLFAAPDPMPEVEASNAMTDAAGRHYWLRFASPSASMADTVTARVLEPVDVDNPPTVIFLHGIGVEFDHWHGMIDDVAMLSRKGIRTVRVEGPWHGRRVPDGRYGGEKFVGSLPLGSLAYFSAQVREAAILIDWCRRHTTGPVAIGGSSLGAHVARLVATQANGWSDALQPDALLLITPCEKFEDAAIGGAFARIWKTAENAVQAGWSPTLRGKFFSLLNPPGHPCMPADQVVAVLGTHDNVTPFPSGKRLVERLGLPADNAFIRRQGHFSTPINLVRDKAPLNRFCRILFDSAP